MVSEQIMSSTLRASKYNSIFFVNHSDIPVALR